MNYRDYLFSLNESSVQDILNNEKIFVMIIGGSASGKNYVYEKHFSKLPLLDLDKITTELSGGDFELARKMVAKANSMVKKDMEQMFKDGKSVAQVSTGANIKGTANKIKLAKSYGMKTAVVLVDVDINTAIKRNQSRAGSGKQGLIPDWKVEKTNNEAKDNFNEYSKLTDYSMKIKN